MGIEKLIFGPAIQNVKQKAVFLHGFLQTGPSFVKMIKKVHPSFFDSKNTQFIVPTAPKIELTGKDIHPMFPGPTKNLDPNKRAWIDVKSTLKFENSELNMVNKQDFLDTCNKLNDDKLITGGENFTLVGFSQGSALALEFALNYFPEKHNKKINKLVLLSNFRNHDCHLWGSHLEKLKERDLLPDKILICHGKKDKMVPIDWALHSYDNLKEHVDNVDFFVDETSKHEPSQKIWQRTLQFIENN